MRIVAEPSEDRWHNRPTPLLGGVGVWAATLAVALAFTPRATWIHLVPLLIAGSGACLLGVIDDVLRIKPASKLTGQIAVGCLALVGGGAAAWSGSAALDLLLTLAWFVAIVNAFNLIDNMDGLCVGIAAIASLFVSLGLPSGSPLSTYAAALGGACAAFMAFNFHPAKIFLGDSGSLFIGASLALLSLADARDHATGLAALVGVPVLLLLIPIFDAVFVTVTRLLSARRATIGGRDHTSHRLVAMGFTERQAVLLLYGFAAAAGLAAMAVDRMQLREGRVLAGAVVVALSLLAAHMARVRVYDGGDFISLRDRVFTPLLMEFTFKRRIFEVLLDLTLVILAYYGAYVIRFDRDLPQYHKLLVASLPIVIGSQLVSFFVAGVYRGVWHYFTTADLLTYVKAVGLAVVSSLLALLYLYRFEGYSRAVFLIDAMALLLLLVGSRFSFRLVRDLAARARATRYRVVVYGAGEGGALLVREVSNNPRYGYHVVGFIDDDDSKAGKQLSGAPVFGGLGALQSIVEREAIDLVVISTLKLDPSRLQELQRQCLQSGTGLLQFEFTLRPLEDLVQARQAV
jgi:UDP-GlcNAc:undecaprenyl-phosphate/decaprenyl-phosphate GlcNAc-1-phosphate transferase